MRTLPGILICRDMAAISIYKTQLKRFQQNQHVTNTIRCLNNLATACFEANQLHDAERYFSQCLDRVNELSDWQYSATAMQGLASVHEASGNLDKAIALLKKFRNLCEQWLDDERKQWADNNLRRLMNQIQ